jgi:hypothetical protein
LVEVSLIDFTHTVRVPEKRKPCRLIEQNQELNDNMNLLLHKLPVLFRIFVGPKNEAKGLMYQ